MISNQYPTIVYGIVNGALIPVGSLIYNSEGQLILTAGSGSGSQPQSVSIFDPLVDAYRTLTAPGGVLTLSEPGQ